MNASNNVLRIIILVAVTLSLSSCDFKHKDGSKSPTSATTSADYYTQWGHEAKRLVSEDPRGIVERLRTESILKRFAPQPPAVVYDIGGAAGVYAFPLAERSYKVHLFDITPGHIEQAAVRMQESEIKLDECSVGDARNIKASDGVADIVLLLGPLYHLQDKTDRMKALSEAYRVLKSGGMIFAAALSRLSVFLSLGDKNKLHEPYVADLCEDVIKYGKSSKPIAGHPFFDTAYFHNPDEFEQEIKIAGFKNIKLLSIEGPSSLFAKLPDIVGNKEALDTLMHLLEIIEGDRSVIGASGHFMAVGIK